VTPPQRRAFVYGAILTATITSVAIGRALADGNPWFSADQVNLGRIDYSQSCAVCHGAQLAGGGAPALKGTSFNAQWNGKTLQSFFNYVQQNMPLGHGGSLPAQNYADIVAFIASQSGLPAGTEKFTPRSPMQFALVLPAGTTSGGNPAGAAATAHVKIGALYGPIRQPSTNRPTQAELDAADTSTTSWLAYNKGYRGERYSSLKQIDIANVSRLRPVCMFQLGELGTFHTGPVVYDGMLYATTHLGTYAIDATTCKKVWSHQHAALGPEMNATNRGIALAGGRVIRGTQDGVLYALDAKTGAPLWQRQVADWSIGEGVGAAPTVLNDTIYVAKAGGDWGIHGRLMTFNVKDGSAGWTFDLVPTGSETGANTWQDPSAAKHGGGAAWVAYALDRSTNTLFVPVGNPGPDFDSKVRPGANLFTNSVVALDARTGKLKWWYQLRPNDDHDWDATVVSIFDAGGKKLIATSGKEGILHVVGRSDGKLVFKLPVTTVLNHDVPLTPQGVRICPVAGVQWNGPAHSLSTGLLYINSIDWCSLFKAGPKPTWIPTVPYTGLANGYGTNDSVGKWAGWTTAVNPTTGKIVWHRRSPNPMYAAVTPTAGNVLFTGDLNGNFLALDARNGNTLYRFNTGGPIAGGVVTYEENGRQYVAVASGNSGGSIPLTGSATIVIFSL